MSGGHWNYLSHKIEERIGTPLDEVWRLLAAIEHELDWGLCCDTCYECAKIRTINALEAYFDTEATSVQDALRLLRSSEPECTRCVEWQKKRKEPREAPPVASVTARFVHEGKLYKGTMYEVKE